MGLTRPLLFHFVLFLNTLTTIEQNFTIDGVLGIQTRNHRMVDADESTELRLLSSIPLV